MKARIAVALAVAALGAFAAIAVAQSGSGTWHVVLTETHQFDVTATSQQDAIAKARALYGAEPAASATAPTTTSSTTTTTTTVPPGPGYPSLAAPFDFDGDFNGCQLVGGAGGWAKDESGTDYPGNATIEPNAGEGPCGAKFTIPSGGGRGRAEVQAPTLSTPVKVTFEQLFYLPSEANGGPHDGSISQTKMNSNPCFNGAVGINRSDGLFVSTRASCSVSTVKRTLGPIPEDHWVAIRVAETFSDSGSIQAWVDPDGTGPAGYVEKLPQTSADTLSGSGLKMRQGLYTNQVGHDQHLFGDGFHLVVG